MINGILTKEQAKKYCIEKGISHNNDYDEADVIKAYSEGIEVAKNNQIELIKAALRFAKDNHKFGFTEDMMLQLFKESVDMNTIDNSESEHDQLMCKFAEWVKHATLRADGLLIFSTPQEIINKFKDSLKQ